MADTPLDERRFTDPEVREILKRAVAEVPSEALVKTEGLSLDELKTIGAEVGVDPARLEDAARDIARKSGSRQNLIIGSPTVLTFERRVDGEIGPNDTPQILSLIRRTMGHKGELSEIHGSMEWSAKGEAGDRYVTLSQRDGRTTVTASANLTQAAALTYLPGLVGVVVSFIGLTQAVEADSLIGLMFFVSIIPLVYVVLRTILQKITGAEAAKLQQVVDELAGLAEGPSS